MPQGNRVPPHNIDAEEVLLSALFIQPYDTVKVVQGLIEPEHFYRPSNGLIYAKALELVEQGVKPDAVTVSEALRSAGQLDAVGGPAELMRISGRMDGFSSNAHRYASIIYNHHCTRRLIAVAGSILEDAYEGGESAIYAQRALEDVQGVVDATNRRVHLRTMTEMVDDYTDVLEARGRGEGLGIMTGWHDLDDITGGMREGQLWVVGAPPKTGKSTFAGNLAMNVIKQGRRVLLVSVEMSETEIMERLMAGEARINMKRLRTGQLETHHWAQVSDAAAEMADLPLSILDEPNATLAEIRAAALRTGAELVIVDYTQLLKAEVRKGGTREQVIAELTGGMKRLARELRCPFLALSQVRRDVAGDRPGLTDFAESSSFEKNGDYLLGLYRDELVNEHSADRGTIEVIVIASRHSETGSCKLAYLGHHQKISNMARTEQPERTGAFGRY